MARLRRTVKVELTDEEKETLQRASKILDELADEDGADDLYELMDNYDSGIFFISCAIDRILENSD